MSLTALNYFSQENQMKYMGSSSFKSFNQCEAKALAQIKGEYIEKKSTALLIGSFVDAYFEGTLEQFKLDNQDIFTKSGILKSEYTHAEYIIQRIERDEMFMKYMCGKKQVIMTGEIEGVLVKIKIDSYHPDTCIVDLKIMKDFDEVYMGDGVRLPFVEAWGYDIQAALYQEVERQNRSAEAKPLPFYIAGATKEKPEPDIALISISQRQINSAMQLIIAKINHFDNLKKGLYKPMRCEKCDYCRSTKTLTTIVDYTEL